MKIYNVAVPYLPDATKYYASLADLPWAVWLDSAGIGRYDILTAAPHHTIEKESDAFEPFDSIRAELGKQIEPIDGIPFAGGALGYWAYDLVQADGAVSTSRVGGKALPAMAIGIYDWALVLDHQQKKARLVSWCRYSETECLLQEMLGRLNASIPLPSSTFCVHGKIASNFTRESYAFAFNAVQDYLRAGDCYQVNLAQCFSANATGDALPAYLELRKASAAPYSAFLNLPWGQVLCVSPERFLQVAGRKVETKPIKGTRPRDSDRERDSWLAHDLRTHLKDRAENLMIVDLLRNDLGKSCQPGSVRVPNLFEVESYASVHHLVSTVEGKLLPECDALHLLQDCFPGGSVTGAPKRRAMQIIRQLEPARREIYCGAIGYVGFDGNMDTNIAIRTLVYSNGSIRCWAGGGIVADSIAEAEYQETLDKAAPMLRLLQQYGGRLASAE